MKRINISHPVLGNEEKSAVLSVLKSGWITQGKKVKEFERQFAKYHQVKHAIAVSNCTCALHLALLALNIKKGDEVIIPSFTWVSTANVVMYCGAKPVFVDIDLNTFSIDVKQIIKKITNKTKAIIPVHLFGLCADIDAIKKIAPRVKIIEDAACAVGAVYKNKFAGNSGDIACFSFHPRKIITTGEGGMITTNNDVLAEKTRCLRNHGASISEEERHNGAKSYILPEFSIVGYNYRMTDIQGAIGVEQMKKLDEFVKERNYWADYYSQKLRKISWLRIPMVPSGCKHTWQSYVCLVDENKSPKSRNEIMEILYSKGISTRPGTHAVHMLNVYKKLFHFKDDDLPNSKKAYRYSLSLPLHNKMKKRDFDHIISSLKDIS